MKSKAEFQFLDFARHERSRPAPNSKLSGQVEHPHCTSCAIWEWLVSDGIAWLIVGGVWGGFWWLVSQ